MNRASIQSFIRRSRRLRRNRTRLLPAWDPRLAVAAGAVVVLSTLMSVHFLPDKVSLRVGDRSPIEIRANRSVTFVDTDATLRHRQFESERVGRVYDHDRTALAQASNTVSEIFGEVRQARADEAGTRRNRRGERVYPGLSTVFTPELLKYLVSSPSAAVGRLEGTARRLVEDQMGNAIRTDTDDLTHARDAYVASARRAAATSVEAQILAAIGVQALRPNELYNSLKTGQQRELASRSAHEITGEVRLGDVIVHEGEVFTQQDLDKCTALGLISPSMDVPTAASICALAFGTVLLIGLFIRRFNRPVYDDPRLLVLLAVTVLISVLGLRVFGTVFGLTLSGLQFGYVGMMTVVAAGMLITVLLDAPLAILITALLSALSGLVMNHEVRFTLMTLVSGLVGIYSVTNVRDRTHLLRATLAIGSANVMLVWLLGGLLGDTLREVLLGSVWAMAAAAVAIAIFWFGVAVLEKPFGILTHVWLLELSASERPLLRQLCVTAPGTYAHSIMVGNLAEAAAEAIGANSLFCRVASYYHDIGKMRRPHCFVENQRAENIHEKLSPSLSALIIASHVRDGIQLAEEHRLPAQIRAAIAEHHGTSLIRYFYNQAVTEGGCGALADPVMEQHFRYDGPRPQTRESGIIMLADSVEAAARCLEKPTPARVQGVVETLVHDRVADGQLDECDLTLRDIQRIQDSFVRVLSGMLHSRIDYPDLPKPEALLAGTGAAAKRAADHAGLYPESAEAHGKDAARLGGHSKGAGF